MCCPHGGRAPTVEYWRETLENKFGCDEASIMGLVLLSQVSPQGYEEANSIIGKLIKAVSDDRAIRKPSAFVAQSTENARRMMKPSGSQFAGMGGWVDNSSRPSP